MAMASGADGPKGADGRWRGPKISVGKRRRGRMISKQALYNYSTPVLIL